MATSFINHIVKKSLLRVGVVLFIFSNISQVCKAQAVSDTLQKVTIIGEKSKNQYVQLTPTQLLKTDVLQHLNAHSVADAAKYFAGVLVKDYGGIGGLKTISVRSLGATHTGVFYDGVPTTNSQTGQVDLSRFSVSFLRDVELHQADMQTEKAPATAYAYGATLAINTYFNKPSFPFKSKWNAGLKFGSFGHWQPYASAAIPIGKRSVIGVSGEYTTAKGDYSYTVENGNFSEKLRRVNSDVQAFQGEANWVTMLSDSTVWQTKVGFYQSNRGLPGSIIFFVNRSVQRLQDNDLFIQSSIIKKWKNDFKSSLILKYSNNFTRYIDPDFLNNRGGLDNRYNSNELYLSGNISKAIKRYFYIAGAADLSYQTLWANLDGFVMPDRKTSRYVVSGGYKKGLFRASVSGLYTQIKDLVDYGVSPDGKHKFTPTLALGVKPSFNSPFMFRAFYKQLFRMPTFNDLYYTQIGNRNLLPEHATQWNLGISYSKKFDHNVKQIGLSIDGYHNQVRDKIVAVPNSNLFVWSMLNVGKVNINGLDLSADLVGKMFNKVNWQAKLIYTYQKALDITDPSASIYKNQLPYTPVHSGGGYFQMQFQDWGFGYNVLSSGKRYALGENNKTNLLNSWWQQDIYVDKKIFFRNCQLQLKAELNNIANTRYDIVRYYPMQGRSFKVSVSISNL